MSFCHPEFLTGFSNVFLFSSTNHLILLKAELSNCRTRDSGFFISSDLGGMSLGLHFQMFVILEVGKFAFPLW